ncbi:hypothetical protein Ancab_013444 [Ancistrocladus abbreviatus]
MGISRVCTEPSCMPNSSSSPSLSNPTTSSISRTETVTGSHHFVINGYSLLKGLGIGRYMSSDMFEVGGYKWAIYYYPDGKSLEDNGIYISLFIALASEGADVRALFELKLMDQSGKGNHKEHSHFGRFLETGPYTLKYKGSMWFMVDLGVRFSNMGSIKGLIRKADLVLFADWWLGQQLKEVFFQRCFGGLGTPEDVPVFGPQVCLPSTRSARDYGSRIKLRGMDLLVSVSVFLDDLSIALSGDFAPCSCPSMGCSLNSSAED